MNLDEGKLKFWEYVDIKNDDECWNWIGKFNAYGYGRFQCKGTRYISTRFSWFIKTGNFPILSICHKCDNPACVNPNHLFEGNQKQNMTDAKNKDRIAKGEKSGRSKLKEVQVIEILHFYYEKNIKISELAKKYFVIPRTIRDIIKGETWKHISKNIYPDKYLKGDIK